MEHKINYLRLHRQGLIEPFGQDSYDLLFRDLAPVMTPYWCEPGRAPTLSYRADFDDLHYNDTRRQNRQIIKGRFQKQNIAYIPVSELQLFKNIYEKNSVHKCLKQQMILELLKCEGPLNIQQIKVMTGMLVKEITPILHKLQASFIIFEDQHDSGPERYWSLLEREFIIEDENEEQMLKSLKIVILRYGYRMVYFDVPMLNAFYQIPCKTLQRAIDSLISDGLLTIYQDGYLLTKDKDLILKQPILSNSIYFLNRNDFLVKSYEHLIKNSYYLKDYDTLYYVLFNGEIKGAIKGKFKNGPFLYKDLLLDEDISHMKEELIKKYQD